MRSIHVSGFDGERRLLRSSAAYMRRVGRLVSPPLHFVTSIPRVFCIGLALSLVSCAQPKFLGPWWRYNKQIGEEGAPKPAPALSSWHEQGPVRFLLVHGVGDFPLGQVSDGNLTTIDQPELGGFKSYEELVEKGFGRNWGKPDFAECESKIKRKAVTANNFRLFIEEYCRRTGYHDPQASARNNGIDSRDFHVIKRNGSVLGFVYHLTATPKSESSLNRDIHFYVVCWSLRACILKEAAFGSWDHLTLKQNGQPAVDGTTADMEDELRILRKPVSNYAKIRGIDWALTDASIFQTEYGYKFEWVVAEALDWVATHLESGKDRLVIVSRSLGSTITTNTLNQMFKKLDGGFRLRGQEFPEKGKSCHLERLSNLLKTSDKGETGFVFYQFSNQYGLLQAAKSGVEALKKEAGSGKSSFNLSSGVSSPEIQVISVYDPNDILGYALPGDAFEDASQAVNPRVANLFVQNPEKKAPLLGIISGHNNYFSNPVVYNLMLYGDRHLFGNLRNQPLDRKLVRLASGVLGRTKQAHGPNIRASASLAHD